MPIFTKLNPSINFWFTWPAHSSSAYPIRHRAPCLSSSLHPAYRRTGRSNKQRRLRVFIWISDYTAPSVSLLVLHRQSDSWQHNAIYIWGKTAQYKRKLVERLHWVELNFNWKFLDPVCCTAKYTFFIVPCFERVLLNCQRSVRDVKCNFTTALSGHFLYEKILKREGHLMTYQCTHRGETEVWHWH